MADRFEKKHKNVLQAVRALDVPEDFARDHPDQGIVGSGQIVHHATSPVRALTCAITAGAQTHMSGSGSITLIKIAISRTVRGLIWTIGFPAR